METKTIEERANDYALETLEANKDKEKYDQELAEFIAKTEKRSYMRGAIDQREIDKELKVEELDLSLLKDRLEDLGYYVYWRAEDALGDIDDDEVRDHLEDKGYKVYESEDVVEENLTDEIMLRKMQDYLEENPQTAKKWLCDMLRLMHTVDTEVVLKRVKEQITK